MNDVLQLTRLERLHAKSVEDVEILNVKPICWDEVDAIFEKKREIGFEYLRKAVE